MKRVLKHKLAALLVVALNSILTIHAADLKEGAEEAVKNFKRADPGLDKFFKEAAGYAILPSVGEGGLVIGGQHGDGLLYEKNKAGGKVTMTEVSVGAQVGGGSFSEVIFFETPAALGDFKKSKWEMSAKAKAASPRPAWPRTPNMSKALQYSPCPRAARLSPLRSAAKSSNTSR
jgi:lipid-binding SYLF domain-containing protein